MSDIVDEMGGYLGDGSEFDEFTNPNSVEPPCTCDEAYGDLYCKRHNSVEPEQDTGGGLAHDTSLTAQGNQVATPVETSGFICNVGYDSSNYWSRLKGICVVCDKQGMLVNQYGWLGVMSLHDNQKCRGYFELSDGYLMWSETVSEQNYQAIMSDYHNFVVRYELAKDKTGRKCQLCSTTRGIGYYGLESLSCFCKPCHIKWLNSPAYDEWLEHIYDTEVTT